MSVDQEPLKIEIPIEEEVPYVPERPPRTESARARGLWRKIRGEIRRGVRKAWNSQLRGTATVSIRKGSARAVAKGGQLVRQKLIKSTGHRARQATTDLHHRVRSIDWKQGASTGIVKGLRWSSQKLARLADRFTPVQDPSTKLPNQPPPQ